MKRQNIELHIEELVLHGFSPGDRRGIAGAVERELAKLLEEKGTPVVNSGEIDRLDGGSFRVVQGSKPESTGAQIARAVYRGMKR
jgi:hypothetical protein